MFRQHMRDVRPIPGPRPLLPPPPPPAASAHQQAERRRRAAGDDVWTTPIALQALSDHFQAARPSSGEDAFLQAGYGPDLLHKLRQGTWPIEASLDLHGATLDQSRERLDRFLGACLAHRIKCVCIVHGKGYGSRDGKPVLRDTVRRWLGQLACVRAYVDCPEHQGGAGAVQVLLRVTPKTEDHT